MREEALLRGEALTLREAGEAAEAAEAREVPRPPLRFPRSRAGPAAARGRFCGAGEGQGCVLVDGPPMLEAFRSLLQKRRKHTFNMDAPR